VALVVAASFEQARAAAALVDLDYAGEPGCYDFAAGQQPAYTPQSLAFGLRPDTAVGDFDTGFQTAPVRIDQRYTTPYQLSQPMEPHACLAIRRGDELILHVSTQIVSAARASIASTLQIDPERIHIVAPYVGGGFGSRTPTSPS
jgi:xanthine dehydrogenase YagR molybdenum-binding subunit